MQYPVYTGVGDGTGEGEGDAIGVGVMVILRGIFLTATALAGANIFASCGVLYFVAEVTSTTIKKRIIKTPKHIRNKN
jgi:hypothetical protein